MKTVATWPRASTGADSQVVSREGYEKLLASVNLIASMPSRLPVAPKKTPSSQSPITILCAAANRHSADTGWMIRTQRNALPAHSYGHFGSGSTREKFAQFRLENCVNPIVPTVHCACACCCPGRLGRCLLDPIAGSAVCRAAMRGRRLARCRCRKSPIPLWPQ